jgi:hypothetical protein
MRKVLCAALLVLYGLTVSASPTVFGVGNESNEKLDYSVIQRAGFKFVRLMVNWDAVERVPGVYDWEGLDWQVENATKAGVELYLNVMWAPAHASGGYPTYEQYTRGCTEFDARAWVRILVGDHPPHDNGTKTRPGIARPDTYVVKRGGTLHVQAPGVLGNDGGEGLSSVTQDRPAHGSLTLNQDGSFTYIHDGSDSTEDGFYYYVWGLPFSIGHIHFAYERDYCKTPPTLDGVKLKNFARALAERYGDVVKEFGVWNEPEYGIYWPPRDWSQGNEHTPDVDRLALEVLLPFQEGIREFAPNARLVGPETMSRFVLERLLEIERDKQLQFVDVFGFHAYSWGGEYPRVAVERVEQWLIDVVDRAGDTRPVWVTETGANGFDIHSDQFSDEVVGMIQATRDHPRIERVVIYPAELLFEKGTSDRPSKAFKKIQHALSPFRWMLETFKQTKTKFKEKSQ